MGRDALSPRSRARVAGKKKRLQEGPNQNVPAGAYGGEEDYRSKTLTEPPPDYTEQSSRYSETPEYLNRQLDLMSQLWREQLATQGQYSPMEQARAERYLRDPVGAAISEQNAEVASHSGIDWFKQANKIPELTPEARIAVQGPSATNQWAQLGAYEGIDPAKLAEMNQGVYNRRAYF